MTIRWPCEILKPQDVAFDLASRTLTGPVSITGIAQAVSSDAGIWKATYANIVVNSRERVLLHRSIAALLEGRLGTILVPVCRRYQPLVADDSVFDQVPHDDDAYFDDDTGYVGGSISVVSSETVAVRGTSVDVTIAAATPTDPGIEPGQHFSVGQRLYRVRSVDYTFSADSPPIVTATITFRPPLRERLLEGDALDFDDPVCLMRLADDNQMDLELHLHRFASPTVNFIEALDG